MNDNAYRVAGVTVVVLFTLALCLPAYQSLSASAMVPNKMDPVMGWRLLTLGWLGPLELCFAWFANGPLAFITIRMLRGKKPNRPLAIITACLALSVFAPQWVYNEVDGFHTGHWLGPAIWVWMSCFVVVLFAAVARFERRVSTSQPAER